MFAPHNNGGGGGERLPLREQIQAMAQQEVARVQRLFGQGSQRFESIQYLNNDVTGVSCKLLRGAQHILQFFRLPGGVESPLRNAPGLTIMTEWIENGTLASFVRRSNGRPIPNRILISFLTCLMIGNLEPEGGGHHLVPILKLIDFDRAHILRCPPGSDAGVRLFSVNYALEYEQMPTEGSNASNSILDMCLLAVNFIPPFRQTGPPV
ncbi:hypothetical protein SAMD00023353_1401970 [Rosellinia necatrix]|uniref:Uncharacterized protein n=1 Tax=Rosellinia necatrix TaxID=77044 RepID=A0A1S8A6Z4_ROSNE|nr:hypothetical protein SAMD00023353_1401970 [Rosellinia necatrix]